MVSLPKNTPEGVTEFCMGCTSNEELTKRLQTNDKLFVQFFQILSQDLQWMKQNSKLVERMVTHLEQLSAEGSLTLDQARVVRRIAQTAGNTFASEVVKSFKDDDVSFTTDGPEVKINHLLLFSIPYFNRLLTGGFKESTKKVVTDANHGIILSIKEFLELNVLSDKSPEHVASLINACRQYLMPDLALHLLKNDPSGANFMRFVDLAYTLKSKELRDACFRFIENNFNGIKVHADSFHDLTIDIEEYTEELAGLCPFFNYFNPTDLQNLSQSSERPDLAGMPSEKQRANKEDFTKVPYSVDLFVVNLNLNGCRNMSDVGMGFLAKMCPNLRVLSLGDSDLITDKTMEIIAGHLTNIESLTLSNCAKLTKIGLHLAIGCLPLKKLSVTEHKNQTEPLVGGDTLQCIAEKRKEIEEIQFIPSEGRIHSYPLDAGIEALSKKCKHLTTLEMTTHGGPPTHQISMNKANIATLVNNNPGLTRIALSRNIDDDLLQTITKTCPNLTAIDLVSCPVRNESLIRLSEAYPNLEKLSLGWNPEVTNEVFEQIINNCPKIKSLSIYCCGNISYKIVEYALQKLPLEQLALLPAEDGPLEGGGEGLLRSQTIALIPTHCPTMRDLYINRRYDQSSSGEAFMQLAENCHHLERLYIQCEGIKAESINVLLLNNRKLSQLNIERWTQPLPDKALAKGIDSKLVKNHPSLKVLSIRETFELQDKGTDELKDVGEVKVKIF